MKSWLITGGSGMLAQDLLSRLQSAGLGAVSLTRADLDVTDPVSVTIALECYRPAVVVNCAAWTAVDDAEEQEPAALAVNGAGSRNLAVACRKTAAVLLHVSTDYVFAGDATSPYAEGAPSAPRSAYGRTKLAGEEAVLEVLPDTSYVVRTAWLYGAGGANFVATMIKLEAARDTIDVVDDQLGQPTWTVDLADQLLRLGTAALTGSAPAGVYHGTSSGEVTWFGLTQQIFRLIGADPDRVRPTTSEAFRRPAPRPAYSVLGHDRWTVAGLEPIRPWDDALAEAVPHLLASTHSH